MTARLKSVILFFFFVGVSKLDFGQHISGYVRDAVDKSPIPFVTVLIEETTHGVITDIDGFFILNPGSFPAQIRIHVLGYQDTVLTISSPQKVEVLLKESVTELKAAVIVAGENPAIPIIEKAIANRIRNNPQKNVNFSYKTYSKMVFGPEASLEDDDFVLTDSSSAVDSSRFHFQQAMQRHYFFITESVTERKFMLPNHSFENVVANRFSGLKNPAFTMIATEFQPFSYYSDYVDILGLKYLSPLANNSPKDYVFELKDSLIGVNDTVYVIYFQPKKGKSFNGLKGRMAISSNGYAIKNIKIEQANPTSNMQVDLEQMSEFIDGKQWFPVQFNTHIIFKIDDSSNSEEMMLEIINAKGKTYVKDIKVGEVFTKKDFPNVNLELSKEANEQTAEYWEAQRKKPLTTKEESTYEVIDSLGKELNFDKKMRLIEAMATGMFPIGPISIETNRIMDYNEFEGLRLGLGVRTNDKISKFASVGAYAAYGFNDVHWKYGGDLKFDIYPKNDITMGVTYQNDVVASGGVEFFKPNAFELRSYSGLYITKMDRVDGFQGYFTFRSLHDFQNKLFFNSYSQSHNYPFVYAPGGDTVLTNSNAFQRAEIGWTMRFGFREKYIRTFGKNVSLGTKYPYLWVRLAHGNKAFGGSFDYTKLDARISKSFLIKGFGKFGFQLDGGTIVGNVPSTLLHYARGMRVSGFNLYIENAFNTMAPNEFVSQNYLSAHIHHSFGPLYKNPYSALEISVVSSAGWGNIENSDAYLGNEAKTMEKGFYESGLLLDNVLISNTYGMGVGVFYRYGPYALPQVKDNFGFSVTALIAIQ